jgi:2'-5' RNA ligase
MLGITIRASGQADAFWRLVDRASIFEDEPSIRKLDYAPHLTLARYEDVNSSLLSAALEIFDATPAFALAFDRICCFDTEPLTLWLAPRHDARLADVHARVHAVVGEHRSDPNYRPGVWQPHCTIATAIRADVKVAAKAFAATPIEALSLTFDRVDVVAWPPPILIDSRGLG